MSRTRARLLVALVGVLAVLGGSFVVASPAMAADGCYGDYCSGRDPSTTGVGGIPCADDGRTVSAVTVNSRIPTGFHDVGRLELRWSPRCQTNWTRLTLWDNAFYTGITSMQDSGYSTSHHTSGINGVTGAGTFWTPMIYSPIRAVQGQVNYSWPTPCTVCQTAWV
jgi:hypothetical protein